MELTVRFIDIYGEREVTHVETLDVESLPIVDLDDIDDFTIDYWADNHLRPHSRPEGKDSRHCAEIVGCPEHQYLVGVTFEWVGP